MLEQKYNDEIKKRWVAEKKVPNQMAVPVLDKVVVNVGFGSAKDPSKEKDEILRELGTIVGQRPVVRHAKKSIAAFNLREGVPVGVKVTLRRKRMYQFLEKLFTFVIPRVRDFRGLPANAFDGKGNYSLGFDDQTIFLEVDPNKVRQRHGFQVTIVTNTDNDELAKDLLVEMGLPLEK